VKTVLYVLLLAPSLLLLDVPGANDVVQSDGAQNGSAATRLKPSFSTSKRTQYVSCWVKKNKLTSSRLVRTPVLVSPDGSHRAYVEVEATAFQPKDLPTYTGPLCENTSRLFFAGSGGATFRLVFSQSAEDFSDGNSLTLVDWSSDGLHLLMERTRWTYESEGNYTDFVVFNVNSGTVTQPDLVAAIAARYGKDCGSENSASGFTSDSKVVLALAPLADDIALMNGAKSCVKRKTQLTVDLGRGPTVTEPLAANLKVIRYGKFLEFPSVTQAKYFPPDFPDKWYAKHLSALKESSLWESSKAQKTQSYRFLWLRTFHHPIAIRIDVNVDGTSLLTTKMTSGAGGYNPGTLMQNGTRTLTREQTNRFLGQIEGRNFWKLPSVEESPGGPDGAHWIIEGVRDGTYHVVDRWSPTDGEIRALGLFMVSDLAKMKLAAKEVY